MILYTILLVGCAGTLQEQGGARPPADLPPPRLVDESLTCEVLEEPELIHREQPEYPAEARKNQSSGEVTVRAIITKEGTIKDPQIVGGNNPIFIDPALEAVRNWRYRPATCDGVPVEMVFHIYMRFWIQ